MPTQEEEPPGCVRPDLAKVDLSALELPDESVFGALRVRAFDRVRTPIDHQPLAVTALDGRVAARNLDGHRLRDVEGHLPLIPGRLLVRDVNCPADGRPAGGQLLNCHPRSIIAVDPESGGLALQCPGGVAVEPRGLTLGVDDLGPDE